MTGFRARFNLSALSEAQRVAQGAMFVVDAVRAKVKPATSVIAVVKAGCTPVRLVLSPQGDKATMLGTVAAGALPREMRLTADQHTLLVVNSISRQLQVIDLTRLPLRDARSVR